MTLRGKAVVVTGATGLVGSHLCAALLKRGAEVVAVIRDADPHSALYRSGDINRVRVVSGALEDPATAERAIAEFRPSVVFHLAAQTQVQVALRSPLATFESNVRGTYLLLEAARRNADNAMAVVVASSDKAYGDADVLPYTESTPLGGTFPYDASKACTDIIAHCYATSYGLPVAVARCGNIFGGGDLNWERLIPGTIRSLLRGERPVLRSNGGPVRDWIYVDDVVRAYMLLAERAHQVGVRNEAFNFSYEAPRDVLSIVAAIQQAVGVVAEPVIESSAKGEIERQHLSSEKARRVLGWKPEVGFDDAMKATVDWYRAYLKDTGVIT